MYLTNIRMKRTLFECSFCCQNQQKTEKNIFGQKMNLMEWFQNLKQYSILAVLQIWLPFSYPVL